MPKVEVLVEVAQDTPEAFELHSAALLSEGEAVKQGEDLLARLSGVSGLEVLDFPPVPMFTEDAIRPLALEFSTFSDEDSLPTPRSQTVIVACEIDRADLDKLRKKDRVQGVWPSSELVLLGRRCEHCERAADASRGHERGHDGEPAAAHPFDLARSGGGNDCRPFRPAVTIEVLRQLLAVEAVWRDGFRGQNVIVGIIDEGVNGTVYPVVGGYARPNARQPGSASIESHGSMCAADVLVAAPAAKLYDYPFLGVPTSGGALQMFQAVLEQRRRDGTPHLTNNSYGFVGRPSQAQSPNHEVWDLNHPMHRKVREVVASGAPAFFAAGNCGSPCPSGNCHQSGIGPGNSIHASNSLEEVITVAAVNSRHERIGYSAQGPGGFVREKPDVSSYSHFFGNFGPGRPAGGDRDTYDDGTSAATPVAAGVAALLLSAVAGLTPDRLRQALIATAINLGAPGWDADTGHGVINAGAAYNWLLRQLGGGGGGGGGVPVPSSAPKAPTRPRRKS